MARINIDIGVQGNPATGDTLRTAMTKINTNFTEVYSLVRDGSSGLIATDVTNGDLKLQANGTGSIEIDTLSIQNSTITSITTNSDITLTPNGTGNVVLGNFTFNADQTVGASEDNYVFTYDHSTGTIGLEAAASGGVTASSTTTFTNKTFDADGTGNSITNIDLANLKSDVLDTDLSSVSGADDTIASAKAIKAYVDAEDANIASDSMTFTNKAGNISQWTNDSNYATQAYVDARDIGDLAVTGSTISAPSNADLTLTTSGTGSVSVDGIQIKGTELSSTDSTQITIKENLHVTGNITGNITGTLTASGNDTEVQFNNSGAFAGDSGLTFDSSGGKTLKVGAGGGTVKANSFQGADSVSTGVTFQSDNGSGVKANHLQIQSHTGSVQTVFPSGAVDFTSAGSVDFTGTTVTGLALTMVGDDSSGTAVNTGETFKVAGATGVTTAVSGDTLTITGPDLSSYLQNTGTQTIDNLSFNDNIISTSSNADLNLDPGGTGNVKILTDQITLGTGSSAGTEAVAIGKDTNAGNYAQAIGNNAGNSGQGQGAVALGSEAGETNQGSKAVAIGNYAGETTQGANAIAIGEKAGQTSQAANSIVINATGAALNNTTASSMVVKPIRNASGTHQLEYNPTTGEVTYDTLASGGSTGDLTITGSTISAPSNADLTLNAGGTGSVDIDGIQIKGTSISSTDSTQININENVSIDGTLTVGGSALSSTLDIAGNTGTGTVTLASQNLLVTGTSNEINVDAAGFALTMSLADNITGIVSVTASGFLSNGAVKIEDNKISTIRSNDDLQMEAAGTGNLVANSPLKFNAGYIEKINTLTSSSTITVNCALASIHTVTLGTSTEFNITNLPTGGTVTLIITQDGTGSRTATFGTDGSTAVKFPGGAPTLSTGAADIDVVTIVNDGTNFLGNCAKNYS